MYTVFGYLYINMSGLQSVFKRSQQRTKFIVQLSQLVQFKFLRLLVYSIVVVCPLLLCRQKSLVSEIITLTLTYLESIPKYFCYIFLNLPSSIGGIAFFPENQRLLTYIYYSNWNQRRFFGSVLGSQKFLMLTQFS